MRRRRLLIGFFVLLLLGLGVPLIAGSLLTAPARKEIGPIPNDLSGIRAVTFGSESGSVIHGWYVPGIKGTGAIALMHGVRSNRLSVVDRARFLNRAGFSVLLFDFRAHGESDGKHISFGYYESKDATAAVKFLRENAPGERIGVLGISMGGAATLLASPPVSADALILEMVYPTLDEAAKNRITARLGRWSGFLSSLLTWQLKPRLGVSASELRPIDRVGAITVPKLFIAGAEDQHTTLAESQRLFDAAAGPKEFWVIPNAGHVDVHAPNKVEYEHRVLNFFRTNLSQVL